SCPRSRCASRPAPPGSTDERSGPSGVAGVPPWRYTRSMASTHPRVQVTVDPELAAAMETVDPHPHTLSRLIRDLAIRGAEVERDARERRGEAVGDLLKNFRG